MWPQLQSSAKFIPSKETFQEHIGHTMSMTILSSKGECGVATLVPIIQVSIAEMGRRENVRKDCEGNQCHWHGKSQNEIKNKFSFFFVQCSVRHSTICLPAPSVVLNRDGQKNRRGPCGPGPGPRACGVTDRDQRLVFPRNKAGSVTSVWLKVCAKNGNLERKLALSVEGYSQHFGWNTLFLPKITVSAEIAIFGRHIRKPLRSHTARRRRPSRFWSFGG